MYNYRINMYAVETEEGIEWVVRFPEVFNYGGSGKSQEEALKNAYENLEFELNLLKEEGKPIPLPQVDNNSYSGKFVLRLTKTLHRDVSFYAEKEGTSINNIINIAVAEYITKLRYNIDNEYKIYEEIAKNHIKDKF